MRRLEGNPRLYVWTLGILLAGTLVYSNLYRVSRMAMFAGTFIERLGCFPIYDSALLTMSGCYIVQNDISVKGRNSYALYVKAPDVSIDLNGKVLSGPSARSMQAGIYIEGGEDVSISNGFIQGFMFGLRGEPDRFGDSLKSVTLDKIRIADTQLIGFKFVADAVKVTDTRVITADPTLHTDGRGLFGAIVEAPKCELHGVQFRTHPSVGNEQPPSVLPQSCEIDDFAAGPGKAK